MVVKYYTVMYQLWVPHNGLFSLHHFLSYALSCLIGIYHCMYVFICDLWQPHHPIVVVCVHRYGRLWLVPPSQFHPYHILPLMYTAYVNYCICKLCIDNLKWPTLYQYLISIYHMQCNYPGVKKHEKATCKQIAATVGQNGLNFTYSWW